MLGHFDKVEEPIDFAVGNRPAVRPAREVPEIGASAGKGVMPGRVAAAKNSGVAFRKRRRSRIISATNFDVAQAGAGRGQFNGELRVASAEVQAELGRDHPAPGQLLQSFHDTFEGLIQFINQKHIVDIPSQVRPILKNTPPFMRATTTASMDTPGPFEKVSTEAFFNVTVPDAHNTRQQRQELMADCHS